MIRYNRGGDKMGKQRLYLMRHGQTLFNQLKKIQGACDSPLTDLGIEQAKNAKESFSKRGITFNAAYSSTQERASDTLEIITDMPYQRLKGLKEWHFGKFEGESEVLNPPRSRPDQRSYEDYFVAYGGEGYLTVRNRITQTLNEIMENSEDEHVLAVSHGGAIYQFILGFIPWEEIQHLLPFANCQIFVFEFENGKFELVDTFV